MKNLEKYLTLLDGEVDGLLLTSRFSRHYGAEFDIAEGVAIVTKAGCRYFTDSRYIESAQRDLKGFEVLCVDKIGYNKRLNDAIADFGVHTLGFEEEYLKEIRCVFLVFSEDYIRNNFAEIKKHADDIEQRLDDSNINEEYLISENRFYLEGCKESGAEYILIDKEYRIPIELNKKGKTK